MPGTYNRTYQTERFEIVIRKKNPATTIANENTQNSSSSNTNKLQSTRGTMGERAAKKCEISAATKVQQSE